MERSFHPNDIIVLPILDTAGAVALVEELLNRAKEEVKNRQVKTASRRMRAALLALRAADRARLGATPADEDRHAAHRAQAAAWRSLHAWLKGWAELPGRTRREKAMEAKRIYDAVFDGGLSFVKLAFKACWAEADQRLLWLEENAAAEVFERLGGVELLEAVQAAHKEYGRVLGIRGAPDEPQAQPSVREPLEQLRRALREYVVQVIAMEGDDASERAARLLAPLARWTADRTRAPEAVDPGTDQPAAPLGAPAPAIDPAPATDDSAPR